MALRLIDGTLYRRISSEELAQILNNMRSITLNRQIYVNYLGGIITIPAGAQVLYESDIIQGELPREYLPPIRYPLLRVESYLEPGALEDDRIYTYTWLTGPTDPVTYAQQIQRQFLRPIPPNHYVIIADPDAGTLCIGLPKKGLQVLPSGFISNVYPVLDEYVLRIPRDTNPRDYLQEYTSPYTIYIFDRDGLVHFIPASYSDRKKDRSILVQGIICLNDISTYTPLIPFDAEQMIKPYVVTTSTLFSRHTTLFPGDIDIMLDE